MVPTLHISTNRKAHHKNVPHQHDLLEVLKIDDQVAAAFPTLDVSVGKKIELGEMRHQACHLEVLGTNDQVSPAIPTLIISISERVQMYCTKYLVIIWIQGLVRKIGHILQSLY